VRPTPTHGPWVRVHGSFETRLESADLLTSPVVTQAKQVSEDAAAGRVELVKEGPRALRILMRGRALTSDAKPMLDELAYSLKMRAHHTFWDLGELESYESGVRVESTRVLLQEWKNVLSVRVFARSQLVRMGVAVANLALRNRVETFSDRAEFEGALRVCAREP
jgi:hypothetical protein